jgi:hypothetical protein
MKNLRSACAAFASLAVLWAGSARADAPNCTQSPNGKDCWIDYSGSNMGMVAVGPRLYCAAYVATLSTPYNGFECRSPLGVFDKGAVHFPPNTFSVFGNATNMRVKSIGIAQYGPSTGPTAVWVMRSDGTLWQSTCDVRFRDGRDEMTNLVQVASPRDTNGNALTFKQMTAVRGYFNGSTVAEAKVVAMTAGSRYVLTGNGWLRDPDDGQMHSGMLIYGSDFLGALEQTSSVNINVLWRPQRLPPLPSIPSNVTLARAPNFTDGLGAYTQPFSLGVQDAWIVTTGTDPNRFIMRTQLVNSAWTAWTYYPTSTFTDFDNPPILPWSIVDAQMFPVTPHRGDLLGIGDNWHLVRYVAP